MIYKTAWDNLKKNIESAGEMDLSDQTRKTLGLIIELMDVEEECIRNKKRFLDHITRMKGERK